MPDETAEVARLRCIGCGFEAPAESEEWDSVAHPPLGTMTRCPECGSTDVHQQESA